MIRTVSLLKFLHPALALFWEICYRYLNDKKWRNILCHHISVLFYHGFFPLSRGISLRLGISSSRFLLPCGGKNAEKGPIQNTSATITVTGTVSGKSTEKVLFLDTNGGTMELKLDALRSVNNCKVFVVGKKLTVTCGSGNDEYWHALDITA